MSAKWTFVLWFERVTAALVYVGLFFLLLFIVNRLPFDNDTQSAVLGFAFGYIGFLITQHQKDTKARRAIAIGLSSELLRLHCLAQRNIRPLNHNLQDLFFPHAAMFSGELISMLARIISDIDSENHRSGQEPSDHKYSEDFVEELGNASAKLAICP